MENSCRSDGVGLAAPQVGVNIRLMVFNPTGIQGDEEFVLVNPKLIHSNKRKDVEEEGCLSFPKIYADVEVSRLNTVILLDHPCIIIILLMELVAARKGLQGRRNCCMQPW